VPTVARDQIGWVCTRRKDFAEPHRSPSWKTQIAGCWEKWEIATRTCSEDFEDMVRMVVRAWGLYLSELKTRLAQSRRQFAESAEYKALTARFPTEFPR